jgi:hypothetical protein
MQNLLEDDRSIISIKPKPLMQNPFYNLERLVFITTAAEFKGLPTPGARRQ